MNRLAAEGDLPGDVFAVASFPWFVWFELDFYCTYTIAMTRLICN